MADLENKTPEEKPVKKEKVQEKKPSLPARIGKRLNTWFREMRSELRKVVWPTLPQVVKNSWVVVVMVVIVGLIVAAFDLGMGWLVKQIIQNIKL